MACGCFWALGFFRPPPIQDNDLSDLLGVGAFTKVYGGRQSHGTRPSHFCRGSSSVVRKALQTLEAIKWVEKGEDGRGRQLSRQGRKDLDRIASQMKQAQLKAAPPAHA